MAVSGSYDYTVTANNIIVAAMEDLQSYDPTVGINANDYATCLRTLNLMTKEWMGKPTFAPGMKRWTRHFAYMFLSPTQNIYQFGQGGANPAARDEYVSCTIATPAALGDSVIEIGTISTWPGNVQIGGSINDTDNIGILLSTGYIQWTTVASGGGSSILTLTDQLEAAVALGAQVFSYPTTSSVDLPLDFLTCVRRDINGIDYPMDKMQDMYEYEQISNKNITSTPIQWFYEKKRVAGNLYLNCFPSTMTDVIRACVLYPIDDEDSISNDMAFPQQWYGGLEWGLAKKLAPKFGKSWTDTMEQNYAEAMASASAVDGEVVPQYFQPNRDDYGSNFSGMR